MQGGSCNRGRSRTRAVVAAVICPVVLAAALLVSALPAEAANPRFNDVPDLTWGTNGVARAVEILGDQVWVGGDFSVARGPGENPVVPRANLAVFDLNTGVLRSFSADTNDRVRAIESSERTMWVGGDFTTVRGEQRARIASFDAITGELHADFSPTFNDDVHAILLHDGWLYVGGEFTTTNGQSTGRLVRMNPITGAVDPMFRPNPNEEVRALAAFSDRIYVLGEFTEIGPPGQIERHVYAAGVSVSTGAHVGPVFPLVERNGPDDHAYRVGADAVQVSDDGQFLFIGDRSNEITKWNRLSGQEIWDRTSNGDIQALTIDDGSVYLGTHEGWDEDLDERLLVAIDEGNGATDQTFVPLLDSFWGVRGLAVAEQGLIAVGEFQNVNGVGAERLAIFRPVGGFVPAPSLESQFGETPARLGDIDCDNTLTDADAKSILDYLVGTRIATQICPLSIPAVQLNLAVADANGDQVVDILDALEISQTD